MKTAAEIIEQRTHFLTELKKKKLLLAQTFLGKIQNEIESELLKEANYTHFFSTHDVGFETIQAACEYLEELGYLTSCLILTNGEIKVSIDLPRTK